MLCLFLRAQADARKEKLLDSYDLQRFLSDFRDLSSWIQSMMGLVSSEELAADVTGAEALLERHQVRDGSEWCGRHGMGVRGTAGTEWE